MHSRTPVLEDTVFGINTVIAGHMADASYFKKSMAHWDAAAKEIRT